MRVARADGETVVIGRVSLVVTTRAEYNRAAALINKCH
jgi:hypothetical protein